MMSSIEQLLNEFLHRNVACDGQFWVAFSGGVDSTALLVALSRIKPEQKIKAIHIHHGLQHQADHWSRHCEKVCSNLKVEYHVENVDVQVSKGASLEEVARLARYGVFETLLKKQDVLFMGHHSGDQIETFMMRLMRGSGVSGLACMPEQRSLGRGTLARPFLNVTKPQLQEYVVSQDISWIEDPSNLNTDFERNFLRNELLPLMKLRQPGIETVINRSILHQAHADHLLNDLADIDLVSCQTEVADCLYIDEILKLSCQRQKNLLRFWCRENGYKIPSSIKLAHVMNDVLQSKEDANPCVSWEGIDVRRYRNRIYIMPSPVKINTDEVIEWDTKYKLNLAHGTLVVDRNAEKGFVCKNLQGLVSVRFRQGGERIKPVGMAHHKKLKHLFQTAGIPPWMRDQLPLIYLNGSLIAVADLWISQSVAVNNDEQKCSIQWIPKR